MGGDIFNASKNTKGVLMYDGNKFHQYSECSESFKQKSTSFRSIL